MYSCYAAKSECSNAIKNIKANYVELTNLPIDCILAMLFAKEVITLYEKETVVKVFCCLIESCIG